MDLGLGTRRCELKILKKSNRIRAGGCLLRKVEEDSRLQHLVGRKRLVGRNGCMHLGGALLKGRAGRRQPESKKHNLALCAQQTDCTIAAATN